MAELAFSVVGKLASSAFQKISLEWGFNRELKKLKETMFTIEAVFLDAEERQTNSEALRSWPTELEDVLLKASKLLDEIDCEVKLSSQGSAGWKLCRFFSSSNPLVFRIRIGHTIKKMRERIDKIAAEGIKFQVALARKKKARLPPMRGQLKSSIIKMAYGEPEIKKKREMVLEIFAKIDKLNLNVTYSFFRASEVIGLDEHRAKQIVYIVACIVAVCIDPFFLYIPFLSRTKMCLGMNTELWKVAAALRTVADFFTAQILFIVSIKSILLMSVKYLALTPIPQILFSEKFILKTLRGYTFWNLSLFCQYGIRLVLIFHACEQLQTWVSVRTLVWFNAPVYLFLYFIVSHVIGASWYYLSINDNFHAGIMSAKLILDVSFTVMAPLHQH